MTVLTGGIRISSSTVCLARFGRARGIDPIASGPWLPQAVAKRRHQPSTTRPGPSLLFVPGFVLGSRRVCVSPVRPPHHGLSKTLRRRSRVPPTSPRRVSVSRSSSVGRVGRFAHPTAGNPYRVVGCRADQRVVCCCAGPQDTAPANLDPRCRADLDRGVESLFRECRIARCGTRARGQRCRRGGDYRAHGVAPAGSRRSGFRDSLSAPVNSHVVEPEWGWRVLQVRPPRNAAMGYRPTPRCRRRTSKRTTNTCTCYTSASAFGGRALEVVESRTQQAQASSPERASHSLCRHWRLQRHTMATPLRRSPHSTPRCPRNSRQGAFDVVAETQRNDSTVRATRSRVVQRSAVSRIGRRFHRPGLRPPGIRGPLRGSTRARRASINGCSIGRNGCSDGNRCSDRCNRCNDGLTDGCPSAAPAGSMSV